MKETINPMQGVREEYARLYHGKLDAVFSITEEGDIAVNGKSTHIRAEDIDPQGILIQPWCICLLRKDRNAYHQLTLELDRTREGLIATAGYLSIHKESKAIEKQLYNMTH